MIVEANIGLEVKAEISTLLTGKSGEKSNLQREAFESQERLNNIGHLEKGLARSQ